MELSEEVSKKPVREYFAATGTEQEVWFEDAHHDLQACIYDPKKAACYTGDLKTVTFTKEGPFWKAGPTSNHMCHDQAVRNKAFGKDAR